MKNLAGSILTVLTALAIFLAWAGGGSEDANTIRIGHDSKESSPLHQALLYFKDEVESGSGNQLNVQIYPARQLGGVRETTEMVQQNNLQITVGASVLLTSIIPEFNVLDSFYLFESLEHAHQSLDHPEAGGLLMSAMGDKGFKGLGFMEVGFRSLTSSARPISDFEDLKGLKIRAASNPQQIRAWASIGTLPTPLSWGEIYTSLQQGLIDSQESSLYSVYAERFYEAQSYLSLTEHTYTNYAFFMNADYWNSLSSEHQILINRVSKETVVKQRELAAIQNDEVVGELEALGLKVNSVPDQVRLQMKAKMNDAVSSSLRQKTGPVLYDNIIAQINTLRPSADAEGVAP